MVLRYPQTRPSLGGLDQTKTKSDQTIPITVSMDIHLDGYGYTLPKSIWIWIDLCSHGYPSISIHSELWKGDDRRTKICADLTIMLRVLLLPFHIQSDHLPLLRPSFLYPRTPPALLSDVNPARLSTFFKDLGIFRPTPRHESDMSYVPKLHKV
jgi:hypothetical protein